MNRCRPCTWPDAGSASSSTYEKYNVLTGGIELPNERYGTIPLHGWTSACVVLLGRRVHTDTTFDEILAAATR